MYHPETPMQLRGDFKIQSIGNLKIERFRWSNMPPQYASVTFSCDAETYTSELDFHQATYRDGPNGGPLRRGGYLSDVYFDCHSFKCIISLDVAKSADASLAREIIEGGLQSIEDQLQDHVNQMTCSGVVKQLDE